MYITYRILAINFRDYKFFRCEFGGLQVLFHFLSQKKSPAKNLVFVQSVSVSQSFFVSVVFFFFEGSRSFDRLIGGTSSLPLQNDMYMYYMATKLLYCCLCTLTAFRLAQVVMTCSVSSKGRRDSTHLSLLKGHWNQSKKD